MDWSKIWISLDKNRIWWTSIEISTRPPWEICQEPSILDKTNKKLWNHVFIEPTRWSSSTLQVPVLQLPIRWDSQLRLCNCVQAWNLTGYWQLEISESIQQVTDSLPFTNQERKRERRKMCSQGGRNLYHSAINREARWERQVLSLNLHQLVPKRRGDQESIPPIGQERKSRRNVAFLHSRGGWEDQQQSPSMEDQPREGVHQVYDDRWRHWSCSRVRRVTYRMSIIVTPHKTIK